MVVVVVVVLVVVVVVVVLAYGHNALQSVAVCGPDTTAYVAVDPPPHEYDPELPMTHCLSPALPQMVVFVNCTQ